MLKDYIVFWEEGLEIGYIVHHVATIIGCCLHLNFPSGAGLIALQTTQTEFGSAAFNYGVIFPSKFTKAAYLIIMVASNSFASYLSYLVCTELDIPNSWRGIYAFLTVLIIVLRCGGWFNELNAIRANGWPKSKEAKVE
jgi:hypothetical protein